MILLGAPPCAVFSSMQQINAKHNIGEAWEKYARGLTMLEFAVSMYWNQIERGRFFLYEHPATAASWSLPQTRIGKASRSSVVVGDICVPTKARPRF